MLAGRPPSRSLHRHKTFMRLGGSQSVLVGFDRAGPPNRRRVTPAWHRREIDV
jgi:hypothetical protein